MNTTLELYSGQIIDLDLTYNVRFQNSGLWKIELTVECDGQKTTFSDLTHDDMYINAINRMRSEDSALDEIQKTLHEMMPGRFEDEINHWVMFELITDEE